MPGEIASPGLRNAMKNTHTRGESFLAAMEPVAPGSDGVTAPSCGSSLTHVVGTQDAVGGGHTINGIGLVRRRPRSCVAIPPAAG